MTRPCYQCGKEHEQVFSKRCPNIILDEDGDEVLSVSQMESRNIGVIYDSGVSPVCCKLSGFRAHSNDIDIHTSIANAALHFVHPGEYVPVWRGLTRMIFREMRDCLEFGGLTKDEADVVSLAIEIMGRTGKGLLP